MNKSKELEDIINKEKDIIPFLKSLTTEEKKQLTPTVKRLHKKVTEIYWEERGFGRSKSYSSKQSHSEKQRDLINKACFVCFNKKDIKRVVFNIGFLATNDDYVDNIIPWYVPKWYNAIVNEEGQWGVSYDKLMMLSKKGLVTPSETLIRNVLPNSIVERKIIDNKSKSFYQPEILLKHPETLKEHIWLLFEEESTINNFYNYLHLENYRGGNDVWITTFCDLARNRHINRKTLLEKTIETSTKGFNKRLSGWFYDLLIKLNPTEDEVLALQDDFFSGLNSPDSKVVNTILKFFKSVAQHDKFKFKAFIENSTILLSSETKSVVNSTLMILDKIARVHPKSRISICKKAAEALIQTDEKIQTRAAKLIAKYGNTKNNELIEEIALYSAQVFYSAKDILKEYLTDVKTEDDITDLESDTETESVLSENNRISSYESTDDLIYLVSQAIDNNDVHYIDLLLNYLPKLSLRLDETIVEKLEPFFKRAFDLSVNFDYESNTKIGFLEWEASFYINDFARIVFDRFPNALDNFKKYRKRKIEKLKEDRFFRTRYKQNLRNIEQQSIPDYAYQVHHLLFIKSKKLIKQGLDLDLLSTPTHYPCWIDPKTLIERIIAFERTNLQMDLADFQIAIGRLPLNFISQGLEGQIEQINELELRDVFLYTLGFKKLENCTIKNPHLWLQSVLSSKQRDEIDYFSKKVSNSLQMHTANYSWSCSQHQYSYKEYDYLKRKMVTKTMNRKELWFKEFKKSNKESESLIENLKNVFSKKEKNISSIYDHIHFKKQKYYTSIQPNDDVKFLYLTPNNPSAYLSHVIHNNLSWSTFYNESSKKNMSNILKGLHNVWYRSDYFEATYLFLATGLLCSEKVARELAAEIWIKSNSENTIDNLLLGQILGRLESQEYAPLKRFTDLLASNLLNISKSHNYSLLVAIDSMLSCMNKVPIRGLKKLIELFVELKLNFKDYQIQHETQNNINKWQEVKSLKSTLKKI